MVPWSFNPILAGRGKKKSPTFITFLNNKSPKTFEDLDFWKSDFILNKHT